MKNAAVFFDVDGVLIDSLDAKGEAFADLFPPEFRRDVIAFHLANGGLNRAEKIARISMEIEGKVLSDAEIREMVDQFAAVVPARVTAADEIPGATHCLAALSRLLPLHAVSAVPEIELREVLESRGIRHFFTSVHGIPPAKEETLKRLIREHDYLPYRCAFIGDSFHDRDAASAAGIPFIFVRRTDQPSPREAVCVVNDLRGLDSVIIDLLAGGEA